MVETAQRKRYYVHGDQHEAELERFFCARCDVFAPAQHFGDEAHIANRTDRYLRSIENWKQMSADVRCKFHRPNDAENILAAQVIEDVKRERAARSRFFRWILRQAGRDDPIGDLANDIQDDKTFPRTTNSLEKIRLHLLDKRAVPEAVLALEAAFEEFRGKGQQREAISLSQRFLIFKRDSYRCCLCGATASDGKKLEVDHKIPVAQGGESAEENLWTLCFQCNRGKGAKNL